ncbi:MAG: CRISPR-associated endoribonuclease Cas6 [Desulfacinum sp.]|jgi:CRISPR-associated endoribonuclease Cas6|nr:CRISPR-associated endoribonuclease Cas6 [Desulfacinum sp.]MBZ4658400.1 system precrRNA processing endoribonuclease protein Cas6 [Desulfacinum sp.]
MPVAAVFRLKCLRAAKAPRAFRALFHPVFLERMRRTDARLGRVLHDAGRNAPYSLSPVWGPLDRGGRLLEDGEYRVHLGLLEDVLEDALHLSLERGVWREPIELGGIPFVLEDLLLGESAEGTGPGRASYEDLWTAGQEAAAAVEPSGNLKVRVRFLSPMAFKRGDLHYPLPDVALVTKHLKERWRAACPNPLPDPAGAAEVSIARLQLATKRYALRNGGTVIGVCGSVTYVAQGAPEILAALHALLHFAAFSGIGVKTTQGMGLCAVDDTESRRPASWA